MRSRRIGVGLLALLLGTATAQAAEIWGVAFVHGTGRQQQADRDYWQPMIIERLRGGLAEPHNVLVVNCDFSQYAWTPAAAGCLAGQLAGFIEERGITHLAVITHSHGGNMMRWLLSNPTYDRRYPPIIQRLHTVVALAPSSAGTPLADAVMDGNRFESVLGWLLGYRNDAVRMQQVSHMAVYNALWLYGTAGRPALPRPFRAVVGTGVQSAPWHAGSACGGYALNLGLAFTRAWLGGCSDGFLHCSSQRAAGTEWFADRARTHGGLPLSHNQSRRDCFGLGAILRETLPP